MQLCTPLFKPLALSIFLLTVSQASNGFPTTTLAHAETTMSVNGQGLISGLHRSLATIVVAYDKKPPAQRSRADALMLDGARVAAAELEHLKSAMADRNGRRMSTSVRKMSEAIGRLQGTYRMASVTNPTVAEGMRALSANWAAFTAHYALPAPTHPTKSVSQAQLNELKDRVSSLESELHRRRAQASDPIVLREVEYVYVEVARVNSRPITIETYQSTLLSLSFITGTMTGYVEVSAVYYPQFHDYWLHDVERSSFYYEGYWDGYYQGYYDGLEDGFFETSFTVPEAININVDQSVTQEVDVYATQEINVLVSQVDNSVVEYSDLPVDAADIAGEFAPLAIDDPVAAAERMADGTFQAGDEQPTSAQPEANPQPPAAGVDIDKVEEDGSRPAGKDEGGKSDDQLRGDGDEDGPNNPASPASPAQALDGSEEMNQPLPENEHPAIDDQSSEHRSMEEAPSQQDVEPEHKPKPTDSGQSGGTGENEDEDPNPWRKQNR